MGPEGTDGETEAVLLNSDCDDGTYGFVPRSLGTTELKRHLFKA